MGNQDIEPKILSFGEIIKPHVLTKYFWLQLKKERCNLFCLQVHSIGDDDRINFNTPLDTFERYKNTYGQTWRCWSSQPTVYQMLYTPWEKKS